MSLTKEYYQNEVLEMKEQVEEQEWLLREIAKREEMLKAIEVSDVPAFFSTL